MTAFTRLTRPALRALAPGQSVSEHGIVYTRMPNGDGRWSVNVMVDRRRQHQVVGTESEGFTRSQAEELVAKIKAAKRERAHGVASNRRVVAQTVAAAAADYLAHLTKHDGRDVTTKARRFRDHLTPHLGRIHVARLSAQDWQAYVTTRKAEGASPATINRERSALLHMFNTMRARGLLTAVPLLSRQQEPEGKLVWLTPAESQRLLRAAKNDQSPHAHLFVMVTLFTGLRQSPALNLRVRDIDVDRRVLWIGQDKAGRREQPMPEVLADYLATRFACADPAAFLFASARAESGRVYQMNAVFARCVERAGIAKHVTPHTMRHTAATNAAHAGLDAATIQAIGGWKTRAMAERYTHAASMRDAMDALQAQLSGRRITPKLQRARRKAA